MRYLARKGITDAAVKEWDESAHPRDEIGRFDDEGGQQAQGISPATAGPSPDKDGVVRPKGQGGRFLPRKPAIASTPVPILPPDVKPTPKAEVAPPAQKPGKAPFDQEAYAERVAGGRFLDEVSGQPTGVIRGEVLAAGEMRADLEAGEMDRSLAGAPDRPPEAWDMALGRAHGIGDEDFPVAQRAGADDLTQQGREYNVADHDKVEGYVNAPEGVTVQESAEKYAAASEKFDAAAEQKAALELEQAVVATQRTDLASYNLRVEEVAALRAEGKEVPVWYQNQIERGEALVIDGKKVSEMTAGERQAAVAALDARAQEILPQLSVASRAAIGSKIERDVAFSASLNAEAGNAERFVKDFEAPRPPDVQAEMNRHQVLAEEQKVLRDKAAGEKDEIASNVFAQGAAGRRNLLTAEEGQRVYGANYAAPGRNGQVRWATPEEKARWSLAEGRQRDHSEQMSLALHEYSKIAERDSGIDYERAVNAISHEYRNNPALYQTTRDQMASAWKHIGGEGPMRLRFAAQAAFGLGYGVAFDAKAGNEKFRKIGEWVREDRYGQNSQEKARRAYDVARFAAVMRREYEESQEDLRRYSDPDFERKHPRGPDGKFLETPDLPNPQAATSFREGGAEKQPGRYVTLYRAIKTGKRGYVPNYIESYAFTEAAAREFGKRIIKVDVPVERILVFQGSRNWQAGRARNAMGNREQEVMLLSDYPRSVRSWLRRHAGRKRQS